MNPADAEVGELIWVQYSTSYRVVDFLMKVTWKSEDRNRIYGYYVNPNDPELRLPGSRDLCFHRRDNDHSRAV